MNLLLKKILHFSQNTINWNHKGNGIEIKMASEGKKFILYLFPSMKFFHLLEIMNVPLYNIRFPDGVNNQTDVIQFLSDVENPGIVSFVDKKGDQLTLLNKASQTASVDLIESRNNPESIYSQFKVFMEKNKINSVYQGKSFCIRYYMRLEIQYYCRSRNISLETKIDQNLRQQFINFLNERHSLQYQKQLKGLLRNKIWLLQTLAQIQSQIQSIVQESNLKMSWYQVGAILITTVHLVSFGYMIFFVDWLGWDIIQPLTYTVGVIYTLLGIRFYRKYSLNRSDQTIYKKIFQMIMPMKKIVHLKNLNIRRQQQQDQLKKIEQKQQILKNRIAYQTCLGIL